MATLITKNSSTTASTPLATQLVQGELAVNSADGKLFYKDSSAAVQVLAWKTTPATAGGTGLTAPGTSGNVLTSNGTAWTSVAGATGDVTLTGTQTLTNKTFTGYTETVHALATSGSIALSVAAGTVKTCAASAAITFTDSMAAGQSVVVMLTNGSTYTVAYPTMTWVGPTGNVAPTLNSANVLVFWKVGSTLYGAHVGKYA